jgi:4'-phosphopantetheinyl transferase
MVGRKMTPCEARPLHCDWEPPPRVPALPPDAVHVWCAALDPLPERVRQHAELLSSDELARAARLRSMEHRRRFVVAHGVLRQILARYVAGDPLQLRFRSGPQGKPRLVGSAGDHRLSFNLSHCAEIALVAVAQARELGVDVERLQSVDQADDIAARYLCLAEQETLGATPEDAKARLLLTYWTRKEALLKATGDGLTMPLDRLDVSGIAGALPRVLTIPDGSGVMRPLAVVDLKPAVGYVGALAVEGRGWQPTCWRWTH